MNLRVVALVTFTHRTHRLKTEGNKPNRSTRSDCGHDNLEDVQPMCKKPAEVV